ncbi:MAG: hypothetical protein PHS63_02700 [Desulfoplanes sp.]|nr:hypothetical protein [Desulfoplanes sp.]
MTEIKQKETELLWMRTAKKTLELNYRTIQTTWVTDVEEEYQRDKPDYLSNAQKRALEVEKRISQNPRAQELVKEIDQLELKIRTFEIDIGFERREFMRYYAETLYQAGALLGAVIPRTH